METKIKLSIEFDLTFKVDNSSIVPKMEVKVDDKYNSQTHLMIKNHIKLSHKNDSLPENIIGEVGDYFISLKN